jgi:uncharacterized protein (TIGR04540 family)
MNELPMIHKEQNQFQCESKSTKGVQSMSILKNPTTVKLLASQVILACDGYIALKMPEKQFRELITHYASQHGKKLFSKNGLKTVYDNLCCMMNLGGFHALMRS